MLTRRGLARTYRTQEANLPCLRGRILFPPHVRENLVDRSRFYVGYDEFTADRPANRLIHLALRRLMGVVRHPANRQRVHRLRIVFSDVPSSTNPGRRLGAASRGPFDAALRHRDAVGWVVPVRPRSPPPSADIKRRFTVRAQGPMWHLATDGAGKDAFRLKPDVVLLERKQVRFILDAKWKRLDPDAPNHGVSQDDAYQLFAYGRRYGCRGWSWSIHERRCFVRRSSSDSSMIRIWRCLLPVRRGRFVGNRWRDDAGTAGLTAVALAGAPGSADRRVELELAWFVGVDWGSQTHQAWVLDAGGKCSANGSSSTAVRAEKMAEWLLAFATSDADEVGVSVETPGGLVVESLMERGFTVHSINPKQLDRLRDLTPLAGAKGRPAGRASACLGATFRAFVRSEASDCRTGPAALRRSVPSGASS